MSTRGERRLDNPHGMPGAIAQAIADLLDARFEAIQAEPGYDEPTPVMAYAVCCPHCPHPEILVGSPQGEGLDLLRITVRHVTDPDEQRDVLRALRDTYDATHARRVGQELDEFRALAAGGLIPSGYRPHPGLKELRGG